MTPSSDGKGKLDRNEVRALSKVRYWCHECLELHAGK